MPHLYKIALGLVGAALLWFFTPVPNPRIDDICAGPSAGTPVWQQLCGQNTNARTTGAIIGLVGGVVLGAIADSVVGNKSQGGDQVHRGDTARPAHATVTPSESEIQGLIAGLQSEEAKRRWSTINSIMKLNVRDARLIAIFESLATKDPKSYVREAARAALERPKVDVSSRLQELERAKMQGLITDEEYQQKRGEILNTI